MSKQELLDRERRWALPVAVTIGLVIVLEVAGFILLQSANLPTGSRLAPVLRAVDPVSSKLLTAALMRGSGSRCWRSRSPTCSRPHRAANPRCGRV